MEKNAERHPKSRFGEEKVMVVPDSLFGGILKNGKDFYPSHATELEKLRGQVSFLDREKAESDEDFRQIIPYVLIYRNNPEPSYFLFKRMKTQGESRLHNLYSIGAGGHINPIDDESGDPFESGLRRELEEELYLPQSYKLDFLGWIYSRIDPVACVHAGMVYRLEVLQGVIDIRETDKMSGEWIKKDELRKYEEWMEGWSKIVLNLIISS